MSPHSLLVGLNVVHGLSVRYGRCCGCLTRRGPTAGPSAAPRGLYRCLRWHCHMRPPEPSTIFENSAPWQHISQAAFPGWRRCGQFVPRSSCRWLVSSTAPSGVRYQVAAVPPTAEIFVKPWVSRVSRLHRTVGASPWSAASPFPPWHLAVGCRGNVHNFVCPVLS